MALTLKESKSIEIIQKKVRQYLDRAESGHDWWHISRVLNTALDISAKEPVDRYVVILAALLHDIADPKFHNGDEEIGPELAQQFMLEVGVEKTIQRHVINIIKHMSFKNSFDKQEFFSPELFVVRDADRLDAIGAIGIARAFSYGGYKGHVFYDPEIPPVQYIDKASYKKSQAPTINHFYEKLLKLKDMMHTETAKKMAAQRHEFMLKYLNQFYDECGERPKWDQ